MQRGPKAVPGAYQIHLTVGTTTQTVTFKVLGDPGAHLTQQDYQSQYDLLKRVEDAIAQIQDAGKTIQQRRASLPAGDPKLAELTALQAALGAAGGRGGRGGGGGGAEAGGAPPRMGGTQPLLSEFTSLYTFVHDSENRPTGAALDRYRDLRKVLDADLAKLEPAR